MDALKMGKAIAFLRKRYGLTQKDVAEYLGISDKAVSKCERGLGTPDISFLVKLAMIFDTDIESILEGNIANFDLNWHGYLALDYAEEISPNTLLYDKPVVYYQLAYLMLASITDICVYGSPLQIHVMKQCLPDMEKLGVHLVYRLRNNAERFDTVVQRVLQETPGLDGVMYITGLSFLYGKDLTKVFRRQIYNVYESVELFDRMDRSMSMGFFRRKMGRPSHATFERGMIAFPIDDYAALYDAANIVNGIQHQGERIADLMEIASQRGLIHDR